MRENLIRPLKRDIKTFKDKDFIAFDVETTVGEIPKFRVGYAIFHSWDKKVEGKTYKFTSSFFYNSKSLTQFIINHVNLKRTLYIFAHNCTFDFSFIDHELLYLYGFRLKAFSDNPFFIKLQNLEGRTIMFLDSMNWYKTSLEKLFPQEKVKIKDFSRVSLRRLKQRCRMDVELLYKLVLSLGGISASDFSFKIFRREMGNIYIEKIDRPIARKSYYGGRVECYYSLKSVNAKYYDVNSLYPAVMKDNLMPVKYVNSLNNISTSELKELFARGFLVFGEVILKVPKMRYPPFPKRDEEKNKLIFPCGTFKTYLASPELKYALDNGYIDKILSVEIYLGKVIFASFVEKYYKLKMTDKENKQYYKLILNSLYGKFGQKRHQTDIQEVADSKFEIRYQGVIFDEESKQSLGSFYRYGDKVFCSRVKDGCKYNVAIASMITSLARMYLYQLIIKAHEVYYVDTDSIIASASNKDMDDLIGEELGQVKREYEGEFIGIKAKTYLISNVIKFKGARITKEQFMKGLQEGKIKSTIKNFSTVRQFIKNGGILKVQQIEKEFDLKDDKRVVLGAGWNEPITLNEDIGGRLIWIIKG